MTDNCCKPSEDTKKKPCCCKPSWQTGSIDTSVGSVPVISTSWTKKEMWGEIRCRTSNSFRMSYTLPEGLYGVGTPDIESPVLVTANYRLSFDMLRRELVGQNAWILVLDTNGINVWCAAGKKTFGTEELVNRIHAVKLDEVVSHRKIILPQLGAPGIHAHVVKEKTGFRVLFGPIRATDIPAYISNGFKASPEMRRIQFPLLDRLVLTPMELVWP